jgi:hypothetical protein
LQAILGGVAGGASGITAVREQRRLEEEQRQKAEEAKRQAERQAMLDRIGLVEKGFVPESSAGAMDMPGATPRTPFMRQALASGEQMVMERSPQMRAHETEMRKTTAERGVARAGEERKAQQFQEYYGSLSPEQQERFGPALRGAQAGIPASVMQQMLPRDTGMSDYQREQVRLGEERLRLQRQQAARAGGAGSGAGGAPSADRVMQSVNDEVLRYSRTPIKGLVEDRMPTEQETYQYRDQMLRLMGLAPRTGQPGAAAPSSAAAQTPPAMPAARPDTQSPQAAAPAGDVPSLAGGRDPFRGPLTQAEAAQLGVDYAQYQQNPEYRKFVDSQR